MTWITSDTSMPSHFHIPLFLVASIFFFFILQSCSVPQPQTSYPSHSLAQKPSSVSTPPQTPILKLETGTHTEDIPRIAIDAANNFLITGSKDKTIRIWDIHNNALVKTLRPPIGPGHEGKIFAVAVSPDGKTIACGGYTGITWNQTFSIYIFNRVTGEIIHTLSNLPSSLGDLKFSPDGRILLAGLHGRTGWYAYRTSDFSLIAKDESYYPTSFVYGVAFDHTGRFATSSYDGFIRLYDYDFRVIAKIQPSEAKRPYGLAFSPDGTRIAVGFEDSPQVALLSGQDLSLLPTQPTMSKVPTGTFTSVAWSQDGKSLYAGGTARLNGTHFLRKWTSPNVQHFIDIPVTQNTILDIASLKAGGVAFAAASGTFGILDAKANLSFSPETAIADFRDNHQGLLLSEDGSVVQFAYTQSGKQPAQFSIETRVLSFPPVDTIPLHPPLQNSQEISVGEWLNTTTPTINGKSLSWDNGEVGRSVAISPDHQFVVLGTSWNLRRYDRKGRQAWQTAIPNNAWGVNISKDGQVAIAALGDGTIRWYRLKDGKELLTFFPHPDHERWVIWTPSGFYDAAPGAEQLIGWHKNYEADYSADFFPVGRFRSISYRPEIIEKMLATWDEKEAIRLAEGEKRSTIVTMDSVPKALLQEVRIRQEKLERMIAPAEKVQELQHQLAEARQMAEKTDQQRLAAEQVRQAQQRRMAQQQTTLEAKLEHLTTQEKQGKQEATEEVKALHQQLANVRRMAEEGEQRRLAGEQARQAQQRKMAQQLVTLEAELARLTNQMQKKNTLSTPPTLETLFKDFPPEVVIFSPRNILVTSDPILTIHYTVITHPRSPVTEVSVLIDGQPMPGTRGIRVLGNFSTGHAHQTVEVPLPQKNCTISILAKHRWATSQPATIRVQWDTTIAKPNLYVLAIGPGDYAQPSLEIPTAAADAEIFIATLTQQAQRLYDRVETKILINSKATRNNILDGLDWLHRQTTQKDVAMLFFAGHSVTDKGGIPYLLTAHSDSRHLRRTSLSLSDISNTVISMAGKSLLFFDLCQPNTPPGSLGCIQGINQLSQELANASNAVVAFLASSGTQRAIHDPSWSHSAFTTALIEGLSGQMNSSDSGLISMNRLELYLSERIKTLTRGHQRPSTIKPHTIQDFPVAMNTAHDPQHSTLQRTTASLVSQVQPAQEILSRLPPIITILSPSDYEAVNSSNLTIRYSVRNPSGEPVTDIVALIDGRPAPKARGVKVLKGRSHKTGTQEYSLTIPKRNVTVSLIAKNRWGASEPTSIRLQWNGLDPMPTKKPILNVLAVGISDYQDATLALGFAAKDAEDFSNVLRRQTGGLYEKVNINLITDQDATKDKILEGLEWIDSQTSPSDLAMIFLAGHGVNDSGGIYYFLPVDADTNRLRRTGLPYSDIKNTIATLEGKTLLFVDSCHAGDVMGMRRGVADINALVNELTSAENGAVVFASSTGRQFALEDPAWGNGAFTKALIEGLEGGADYRKTGVITVNMLALYLSERVKALTNGQQTPTTTKPQTIQDFPIAIIVRAEKT